MPYSAQHLERLSPPRQIGELVRAQEEDGTLPLRVSTQHVDGPGVSVERDALAREGGAGELETTRRRRIHLLVSGRPGHEHDDVVEAKRLPGRPHELDVAVVGRVEGAAEEPDHGTYSYDSAPTSTAAPRRAPASRRARSSSAGDGGDPTTRKPPSVRRRLQRRALAWGR